MYAFIISKARILVDNTKTMFLVFSNNLQIDFIWRYLLLLLFTWTVNIVWYKVNKHIYMPIIRKIKKPFLFTTSFGSYVWKSFDARGRMHKDYEPLVRKFISINADKYKPQDNKIYCLNIWANQWRWAVELAKVYNYNVIAFEPVPSIYSELMSNI